MTRTIKAKLPKIAHVGWTGSGADRKRYETVADHEAAIDLTKPVAGVKFDLSYEGPPDVRYGSDFLADSRRFDVVILHWIFVGWDELETQRPAIADHFAFTLSPAHSPDAWRVRLADCGARTIYVFGGSHEVSGSWLLEIRGYRKRYVSFGTIFERE